MNLARFGTSLCAPVLAGVAHRAEGFLSRATLPEGGTQLVAWAGGLTNFNGKALGSGSAVITRSAMLKTECDLGQAPPLTLSPCGQSVARTWPVTSTSRERVALIINGQPFSAWEQCSPPVFSAQSGTYAVRGMDRARWYLVVNGDRIPIEQPIRDPRAESGSSSKVSPVFLSDRVVRAFVMQDWELVRLDVTIEGELPRRPTFEEVAATP